MNFYRNYVLLCAEKGKAPSRVSTELGFSSGVCGQWKNGAVPSQTTLIKVSDYFGITVDELIGEETPHINQKAPADNSEDKNPARDVITLLINDMTVEELVELIAKAGEIKKRRHTPAP